MSGGGGRITNRAGRERPRFIRPVERQRMRPWLEEHLDKNDIPGLTWVNKKDKIFRIAWKHAANQCFNLQKDTNLFERWAIHTGRHYDSDHKRWKANFRCALNSLPDVKENKEQGIKKGNNAFKVYKFLDEKETRGMKDSKVKKKTGYGSDTALKPADNDSEAYGNTEQISVDDNAELSNVPSIPKLDQLYTTSGVEMLIEADANEKVESLIDTAEDTNLQEILTAATASVAAGSDPATLEKISIDQLKRLGDVSRMRLDVRQSSKKNSSGYMYVFLCRWCEKVFPRKIELFQHFLITHHDKLLAGEEYGEQPTQDTNDPKHQKLLEEIQDLELKVLGFSENSYQSSETGSEGINDDETISSEAIVTESEEKALDLTVSANGEKTVPKQETALDLSMSAVKRLKQHKLHSSKHVAKRRRGSQDGDINYSIKFGNYGIAGAPRTKRQMSLHSRRMEEEQERLAKKVPTTESTDSTDTSRQHSMEDIVHAEMLLALKTGNDEGSEKGSGKSLSGKKDNSAKSGKKGKASLKRTLKAAKTHQSDKRRVDKGVGEKKNEAIKKKEGKKPSSIKAFKCGLCFMKFSSPGTLFIHVKSHQGIYLHTCRNCGEQCKSQEDLIQHISLSHPNYPHLCNFCGKFCKTVKKLKNHMWSHICVCELCGEKFYNSDLFDIHLKENHQVTSGRLSNEHLDSSELPVEDLHESHQYSWSKLAVDEVERESDDSDESVDEEEDEGDKDSNATTEIAEDSDNDPDNSDGIKISDTSEKSSECNVKDGEEDDKETGSGKSDGNVKEGDVCDKNTVDSELEDSIKEETMQDFDTLNKDGQNSQVNFDYRDISECGQITKKSDKPYDRTIENCVSENTSEETDIELKLVKLQDGTDQLKKEDDASNFNNISNAQSVIKIKREGKEHFLSKEENSNELENCSNTEWNVTDDDKLIKSDFDDKLSVVEEILDDSLSNPENPETDKKAEYWMKTESVDPESRIYRNKATQLKRIMGTSYSGTCLLCNRTIPMSSMVAHIKSHSVVTLSKAKDALDMLGINIAALERPLFVCNLCNMGFKSCSSLSAHVTKHLVPMLQTKSTSAPAATGGKKRKIVDTSGPKAKCQKSLQLKTSVYVRKQGTSPPTSVIADQTNIAASGEGGNSGSILAAYLNAGPMYQCTSLADMVKQSNDASNKTDTKSADTNHANEEPFVTIVSEQLQTVPSSVTPQLEIVKEKTDTESMIANAQRFSLPPKKGAVLVSVNAKGDASAHENPKPIPMMFLKGDTSQEVKLVPASSVIQLSHEFAPTIKGGQILKVFPQGMLQANLGNSVQSVSAPGCIDVSTPILTAAPFGNQPLGTISSLVKGIPSVSTSPSMLRNAMVSQSTESSQKLDQHSIPHPLQLVKNSSLQSIESSQKLDQHSIPHPLQLVKNSSLQSTESSQKLGQQSIPHPLQLVKNSSLQVTNAHHVQCPIVSLTSDCDTPASLSKLLINKGGNIGSVGKTTELSTISQLTTAKPVSEMSIVTSTLPASISHGQNLPVSLQHGQNLPVSFQPGQLRLVSPVGTNQSTGQQQITILKWPLGVQMIRGSSTQTIVKPKQVSVSMAHLYGTQIHPTSNLKPSTDVPGPIVCQPTISRPPSTGSNVTSLPLESLLKKTPVSVPGGSAVPITSSAISGSATQISVVKPNPTLMNVMLSQYLQSQAVMSTPGSSVANACVSTKSLPTDQTLPESVKGIAQKPTFNLVITQAPLAPPTLSTSVYSNQSAISSTSLSNKLSFPSVQENKPDTVPTNTEPSTANKAPVTNRLALICNLCSTEIQNLEMIGQHVCSALMKATPTKPATMDDKKQFPPDGGAMFPCVLCNREFQDLDMILIHQKCHNTADKAPLLHCKLCSKVFQTDLSYGNHMKTCHSNRLLYCPLCLCTFPDQNLCVEHIQTEHSTQTKCDLCPAGDNKLFLTPNDLSLHRLFKHPYECTQCEYRCAKIDDFLDHVMHHTQVKVSDKTSLSIPPGHDQGVICKKCLVGFVSLHTFQSHVRVLHPGESFESLKEDNPEKCPLCEFSFKHKKALNQHIVNVHMRKLNYSCSVCNQYCGTPSLLVDHLKKHWPQNKMVFSEFEILFCHLCQLVFPTKLLHTQHVGSTHCLSNDPSKPGPKPPTSILTTDNSVGTSTSEHAICVDTNNEKGIGDTQPSLTRAGLSRDEADVVSDVDHVTPMYTCDLCGFDGFKSEFLLKQHRVIRHLRPHPRPSASYYQHVLENIKRPKSFDCIICGKKFESKPTLKLHMKSHLKNVKTNFVCSYPECNSRFNTRRSCLNHIKVCPRLGNTENASSGQTGADERLQVVRDKDQGGDADKYLCKICSHVFKSTNRLKRHLMWKHSDTIAKCLNCDEVLSRAALKSHVADCKRKLSRRRKLYGCALCKEGFHTLMNLTKHLLQHDEYERYLSSVGQGESCHTSGKTNQSAWFMCVICEERFCESASLFQHVKSHFEQSKLDSLARNKLRHAQSVTGDLTKVTTSVQTIPGNSTSLL